MPAVKKTPSPAAIVSAAARLAAGELVALPTETVYGLGADATSPDAVKKIFAAKGRPADHPLIVHLAKDASIGPWTDQPPATANRLISRFWPGPLTLILKKSARIPMLVTGGQDTVGLRCPAHPVAQALLHEFAKVGSGLIAAPSANRFGHVSPTTAQHVRDEFGAKLLILDGGPCKVGIESTILDLSRARPVLLRPGAISREDLAEVLGEMPQSRDDPTIDADAPRVSGSLAAHYAPMTPLRLVASAALNAEMEALLAAGQRVAVLAFATKPRLKPSPAGVGVRNARPLVWITAADDAAGYAQNLYANLRTLDAAATSVILVETPPIAAPWEAVNDRLGRAATGSGHRPSRR